MNSSGIISLIPRHDIEKWKDQKLYPNKTIFECFCNHVNSNPLNIAVFTKHTETSYSDLYSKALQLAKSFNEKGLVEGDVLIYQIKNSVNSIIIDLACAALGIIVCPLPFGKGQLDIEAIIKRTNTRAIIIEDSTFQIQNFIEQIRPNALSLRVLISLNKKEHWLHYIDLFCNQFINEFPILNPDDPIRFLVSSGTESDPKIIAYSHNSLLGGRGKFIQNLSPKQKRLKIFYLMSLGTAFGSTASSCVLAYTGGGLILQDKFCENSAIELIQKHNPTHVFGVPTMFQRILNSSNFKLIKENSIEALVSGGANIDPHTISECINNFQCDFINLYGSADGINCMSSFIRDEKNSFHTVGKPNIEICEIKIIDNDGNFLKNGDVGEIIAKGPITPLQYVNNPKLDEQYRNYNGWVLTGDLGRINTDGYLELLGRKKDIIIRGGQNISPKQIEFELNSHKDIISSICISIPDNQLGERVCACITMNEGVSPISLERIQIYLEQRGLEKYKCPEYICFKKKMPLNSAGKVDKKSIKKIFSKLNKTEIFETVS